MNLILFLCFVAPALAAPGPEKRIVHGSISSLFVHPHQVSIQVQNSQGWYHTCGGILIGEIKILTAAHCLQGQNVSSLRVEVGVLHLNEPANAYEQTIGVSSFIIHEEYNRNGAGIPNDIGIIYLSKPVILNENVQIAQLAPQDSRFDNTECVITGWGQTSGTGPASSALQEVNITAITTDDCAARWPGQHINIKHICCYEAAAPSGHRPSACMGDSGGPMMCGEKKQFVAGITSWGLASCSGERPSVYTAVVGYLDWISGK